MAIFNSYVKLPEGIILMRKSTISTGPFSMSQTVSLFTRPGQHRSIATPPFLDPCPLNGCYHTAIWRWFPGSQSSFQWRKLSCLVVGIPTPLKNEFEWKSVGILWHSQQNGKVIKFHIYLLTMYFHMLTICLWLTKIKFHGSSHHQPDSIYILREFSQHPSMSSSEAFHRFPMEFPYSCRWFPIIFPWAQGSPMATMWGPQDG